MKSMESQVALTASIAQSRTMTGPDGKAIAQWRAGPCRRLLIRLRATSSSTSTCAPALALLPMASARRFDFKTPDIGHGRFRLGNENDFYFETGPIWTTCSEIALDPDVVDVKAKMTIGMHNGVR